MPPTSNQMVMGWMEELGTKPAPLPKSQWAPEQQPLPQSREALAAAAAPTSSAVADTPASGSAGKPASSDVQRPRFSVAGSVLVVVGVVAAAGLW